MKINFNTYKDKVEACWIGKNIGGTMGTPYEGRREILDVKGFVTEPGEPLPNDDLDLQLAWLHALENIGPYNIDAATLGEFWISYITPHWKEYGIAKANMKRGLIPPVSGEYDNIWSKSNGAWIRTEIWACVAPAIPTLAAKYAIEDAKVDHGVDEGTVAAAFVAAMQSSAFILEDLNECISVGLNAIPSNSRVAKSIELVIDYYNSGKSWVDARNAVLKQNSDIGDGWFEAPSNVAYAVIGLLYGEGDFKKSVLIAINCGDDTDCTAATAGATLGILYGNAGIPSDWREYIGDKIITVSLSQGCVGGTLPKSCSELSRRVVAMAPSVLQMHNARYDLSREYKLEFGEQEISAEMPSLLKKAVSKKVKPSLEKFKRYTMHFEKAFLTADVTLSSLKIAPMGEVNVHINFGTNLSYENQPHSVSLKWILPEGFRVEGEKSLFIQEFNGRTNAEAEYDFRLVAGENVSSENRIVLEVIPHGRHTAMYISFLILG